MTLRAPKSGEQLDHVGADRGTGEERDGRLGDVRQVGGDPVAAFDSEGSQPGRDLAPSRRGSSPHVSSACGRSSEAWTIATRSSGLPRKMCSA